jgi:hypothetical protein
LFVYGRLVVCSFSSDSKLRSTHGEITPPAGIQITRMNDKYKQFSSQEKQTNKQQTNEQRKKMRHKHKAIHSMHAWQNGLQFNCLQGEPGSKQASKKKMNSFTFAAGYAFAREEGFTLFNEPARQSKAVAL